MNVVISVKIEFIFIIAPSRSVVGHYFFKLFSGHGIFEKIFFYDHTVFRTMKPAILIILSLFGWPNHLQRFIVVWLLGIYKTSIVGDVILICDPR